MGLFVNYISSSLPRGVYAVSVPPPATITPVGTGNTIAVGQFPWGPTQALTYPGDMGSFWATFAPAGMVRTGSAHLTTIRKGWPQLGAVRVADPSAVAASALILTSTPATLYTVTAKYTGTNGNSILITNGASGDGISGHFSMTAAVSSASGTTIEFYDNLNLTGTGADVLPNLSQSVLLGSFVKAISGTPVLGNTSMTSGTNGTITAAMYVGTPGGDDAGFALLEADNTIDGVYTDDPGNSFRPTVNAGLNAHGQLVSDRIVYLQGPSGQTAAQAQSDVASYRSIYSVYVDPWVSVSDDTDGTIRNTPGGCWGASVAAQLPPSVAISWRAASVGALLAGISGLEANRGAFRAQNTAAGIATLIPGQTGGFTFEAGVNTSTIAGQTDLTRTRMGIYIAQSAVNAWYPFVDAPNVPAFQQDLVNSADIFLSTLKNNANINPAVLPYIVDYAILPPGASNTQASIQAGGYNVAAQVEIGASMSRISLSMQFGTTVTVAAA